MSDSNLAIGSGDPLLHKTPDESKSSSEGASANMFMGVTLKGWAISAISAVAVLTSASTGFVTVFNKVHEENLSLSRTVRTVSSVTQAKLTEAQKHEQNNDHFEPIAIDSGSGGNSEVVSAAYYPSDGCIHISRKKSSEVSGNVFYGNDQDVWVIDPLRALGAQNAGVSESQPIATPSNVSSPQIRRPSKAKLLRVGMFQTGCLNPHPGKFSVENQQINACSVKVTRTFNDGCRHYQMYNSCNGQWDPKINWLACSAQHHP